jgi:hypothetical protein
MKERGKKMNKIIKIMLGMIILSLMVYAVAFAGAGDITCDQCKGWYYDKEADGFKTQFCARDEVLEGQCTACTCTYYCKVIGGKEQWFKKGCVCDNKPCDDIPQPVNPFE